MRCHHTRDQPVVWESNTHFLLRNLQVDDCIIIYRNINRKSFYHLMSAYTIYCSNTCYCFVAEVPLLMYSWPLLVGVKESNTNNSDQYNCYQDHWNTNGCSQCIAIDTGCVVILWGGCWWRHIICSGDSGGFSWWDALSKVVNNQKHV